MHRVTTVCRINMLSHSFMHSQFGMVAMKSSKFTNCFLFMSLLVMMVEMMMMHGSSGSSVNDSSSIYNDSCND